MNRFLLKNILKIDSLAALCAAIFTLGLRNWIAEFYEISADLVLFVGAVNLAYGSFGLLNLFSARKKSLFVVLICGNFFWTICCFGFVLLNFRSLSALPTFHGLFEGAFVGALALYESKHFNKIITDQL